MGYELNKLMKQYGVNTASVAGYAGAKAPGAAPVAPTALAANAKSSDVKKYDEALAKYNTDKAAYDAQLQNYNTDKATYDAYRNNYFGRLQGTPMYLDAQYQTSDPKSLYINPAVNAGTIGDKQTAYGALRDQGFSDQDVRTQANRQFGMQKDADWTTLTSKYEPGKTAVPAGVNYNLGVATPSTVQDLYRTYLGREADAPGLANWQQRFGVEVSPQERAEFYRAAMPEMKTRGLDFSGRNAYNATGSYWGDQLSGPTYSAPVAAVPSAATATATNSAAATTSAAPTTNFYRLKEGVGGGGDFLAGDYTTYTPEDTVDMSRYNYDPRLGGFIEKPVVYDYGGYAHGGRVRGLAQKYQVGGAVHKFRLGGDEGEPEDEIERAIRERGGVPGTTSPVMAQAAPVARDLPPASEEAPMPPAAAPTRSVAPVTASPAVRPVVPPPAASTPVSPAATDLVSMMNRYLSNESVYGADLAAARKRVTAEDAAFQKMIADAIKPDGTAPDKTEMYFRLAAAFGAPTKTGHFAENLGLVGKELGEYSKDIRAAKKADRALQLQLGLEAQKLKSQGAREELNTLRTLTAEEMKDKRAIVQEYLKSGRPQSEAGKAAIDAGLTQGTPEFTAFVNKYISDKIVSGNIIKEAMVAIAAGNLAVAQGRERRQEESGKKLTPAEVKLKSEAESAVGGLEDAMSSLSRAYKLNPNTFDGTWASIAQQKVLEQTDPKDPRVLATREQRNLLGKGAIERLKASFGGNPTEGERNALLELEGLDAKSKEERARIMKNTYDLLKIRRERERKRLNDINAGLYRETTPASSGEIE